MPLWDQERIPFTLGDLVAPVEHWSPREHLDRYRLAAARLPQKARVLDVGCGVGYGAYLMAEAGAAEVIAVDRDSETLAYAAMYFRHDRVQYVRTDLDQESALFAAEAFDLVTCFEVLEHVEDPERLVAKIARCLIPRGVFLASSPIVETTADNKFHKRNFTPTGFRALIRNGFRIYETFLQNERILCVSSHRLGAGVEPSLWPDQGDHP